MTIFVQTLCLADEVTRTKPSALPADKASRTPDEQKIDSSLLDSLKKQPTRVLPETAQGVWPLPVVSGGIALVDIKAEVTDAVLDRIRALGGSVISSFTDYHAIRATMPIDRLLELASMREVSFIRPAEMGGGN